MMFDDLCSEHVSQFWGEKKKAHPAIISRPKQFGDQGECPSTGAVTWFSIHEFCWLIASASFLTGGLNRTMKGGQTGELGGK